MPGKTATPAPTTTAGAAAETRFTQHTPQRRRTAQRGLYAGPAPIVSKDLYAELEGGSAVRERAAITLGPASKESGNTYFGRFPASYWERWSGVPEVWVEAVVSGTGLLSMGPSDVEGEPRVVE